jgi:hypothetical protein
MLGDLSPMDFVLAETLGKSLGEVRAMPQSEFAEWEAFYKYRRAQEEASGG